MKKKFNVKKFAIHVGKIAIIMAIIFLVIYLATLLSSSTTFYEESVDRNARVHFNKDMKAVSDLVEKHYDELYKVADQLKFAETPERVDEILSACIGNEAFGELRYYSQNVAYYFSGDVVAEDSGGYDEIQELAIRNEAGCTPVFYDDYYGLDCVAFFVPVRGSNYVMAWFRFFPRRTSFRLRKSCTRMHPSWPLSDSAVRFLLLLPMVASNSPQAETSMISWMSSPRIRAWWTRWGIF